MKFLTELPRYQKIKRELTAKNDFVMLESILNLMLEAFNFGMDKAIQIFTEKDK